MKLRAAVALGLLFVAIHAVAGAARGQSMTQVASSFAPGGQELFLVDFTRLPIGAFPGTIRRLSGTLDVVTKDGMPMLRAKDQAEFLITLSNLLPQNFTIEVDIIPKEEGGPQPDLTLEGTLQINQGSASAHLLWIADPNFGFVAVVGGAADNVEFPIPDEVRVGLPGALNKVGVSVQGGTITFYTNGRQLYAVPAQFARSRYLRVTLGGVTDGDVTYPVYVARVRIATGGPVTVATAVPATMLPATTTGTITPIAPSQTTPPASLAPFVAPSNRTIDLAGITGVGAAIAVAARNIELPGVTASGPLPVVAGRTIALSEIRGTGAEFSPLAAPAAPSSRSITLPEIAATGSSIYPRSRTIQLAGVTASGSVKTP